MSAETKTLELALCRLCFRAVKVKGNVHVRCQSRRDFIENIDDIPDENPLCQNVDYFGNETGY